MKKKLTSKTLIPILLALVIIFDGFVLFRHFKSIIKGYYVAGDPANYAIYGILLLSFIAIIIAVIALKKLKS